MKTSSQSPAPNLSLRGARTIPAASFGTAFREFLEAEFETAVIMGEAMDGQIWGSWDGSKIWTAAEVARTGAPLRAQTLQELFCFDGDRELRVWRRGGELRFVLAEDSSDVGEDSLIRDESYILVGSHARSGETRVVTAEGGTVHFTVLEGRAGEIHAPPIDWGGGGSPPKLQVRLYYRLGGDFLWELAGSRRIGLSTTASSEGGSS